MRDADGPLHRAYRESLLATVLYSFHCVNQKLCQPEHSEGFDLQSEWVVTLDTT